MLRTRRRRSLLYSEVFALEARVDGIVGEFPQDAVLLEAIAQHGRVLIAQRDGLAPGAGSPVVEPIQMDH
jgi:hypothetical protein